ncbi:MAG: FAD-binding oxidoreductase [Candidatus Eremiobacteraeota bacterium]|nr:FAD-binding oxidoreductase [Candidatus Eremiobacteraeota bacterium]
MRGAPTRTRARPGGPNWPSTAEWERLRKALDGRLVRIKPAFHNCSDAECDALFRDLKNPYYINEHPNVTQTLGWADAWKSEPSIYAVPAQTAADVAEAVRFARQHDLRLVVRGGAHSYQGTSNAPDSLMVWTRPMSEIVAHDAFVPERCSSAPVPAVSVGAGAIWLHLYQAVTTQHGRYVQGGGCTTVGVAGFVSGGGFGSWSKRYGTGAGSLLEAQIVTADGSVRVANACQNSDLFWAIKGGGGSTFGVLTRLTLQTHDLPENFGIVIGTLTANSDEAFRRLVQRFVAFYAEALHNEHWGEQAGFRAQNALELLMVFQGLDEAQAQQLWQPFLGWVAASPADYTWTAQPQILAVPARRFWDVSFIEKYFSSFISVDQRPGAKPQDFWWAGNTGEAGEFLHEYRSLWLPAALLTSAQRERLAEALYAASRQWQTTLHFNKGLSGAPPDALARARNTATNPQVLDAFALAIIAGESDNVYPGVTGHEPDLAAARSQARRIRAAYDELRHVAPNGGAYVSEASYFDERWQEAYWGENYARLRAIKDKYDPSGLFIVHHGVGSERWSRDGFTLLS